MPLNFNILKAHLASLRVVIEEDLRGSRHVPTGYLNDAVVDFAKKISIDLEMQDKLIKHLETMYFTRQTDGATLRNKTLSTPWLQDFKKREDADFHYWSRLESWWRERSILPDGPLRSVDRVTDEILGLLGSPLDTSDWSRRGLVMGHVQMGKTTNYSALVSKAADVGYKYIIVLSGLTKVLRYQTQVRLDKAFVGRSSVTDSVHAKQYPVSNILAGSVGEYNPRHPICLTTQLQDFNTATAKSIGADEKSFREPLFFVTKKTATVLEKIFDWLSGLNTAGRLDGPLLLIDDEADNASINTKKDYESYTRINFLIRQLLSVARRSSYVGYTATPFANIFIHPESTDQMVGDELFPRDFIKFLDPPDNYIGPQRVFSEGADLSGLWTREIPPEDYMGFLRLGHKANDSVGPLPESLVNAFFEYLLFRCIRISEGNESENSAMLINVSRFNRIQKEVETQIIDLRKATESAIRSWARTSAWDRSELLKKIYEVWLREYGGESESRIVWDTVRNLLIEAIVPTDIRLINMNHPAIDYEKAPPSGMHIVAIGGLSLSRGLTLEGLAVSYVLRNVSAQDTLLQIGRWFGYRIGYEQLCRLHLPSSLISDFTEVNHVIEELGEDFKRMEALEMTPLQFGLKVRQSSAAIAVTASNKMYTSEEIRYAEDFSLRHIQGHSLHNDSGKNTENLDLFKRFIETLATNFKGSFRDVGAGFSWSKVPVRLILEVIDSVSLPQLEFSDLEAGGKGVLYNYILERHKDELKEWDVGIPKKVIPQRGASAEGLTFSIRGLPEFLCRSRSGAFLTEGGSVVKVNEKNAVAFGDDELKLGEVEASFAEKFQRLTNESRGKPRSKTRITIEIRSRPLLLLHFLTLKPKEHDLRLKLEHDQPVATLGVVLPSSNIPCVERTYRASRRLQLMLKEGADQDDDDFANDDS